MRVIPVAIPVALLPCHSHESAPLGHNTRMDGYEFVACLTDDVVRIALAALPLAAVWFGNSKKNGEFVTRDQQDI